MISLVSLEAIDFWSTFWLHFISSVSASKTESVFLQRHLFWRKLSVYERENFSTFDEFRWIDLEEFAENNLDSETLEIITKLRKNPNGNCLCFIEVLHTV
jgi:hypothetical protein